MLKWSYTSSVVAYSVVPDKVSSEDDTEAKFRCSRACDTHCNTLCQGDVSHPEQKHFLFEYRHGS